MPDPRRDLAATSDLRALELIDDHSSPDWPSGAGCSAPDESVGSEPVGLARRMRDGGPHNAERYGSRSGVTPLQSQTNPDSPVSGVGRR
jgi:hypothetical protein